jgi:uncharacterized protein YfeS
MNRILIQTIGLTLVLLCSCSDQKEDEQNGDTDNINTMYEVDYNPDYENAHPKAKELMNEDFFYNSTDETGPFGSDDAADTYAGFAEWRIANKSANPKDFLIQHIEDWGYPDFDLTTTDFKKLKPYLQKSEMHIHYLTGIDQSILAIAFGQLYIEGKIDDEMLLIAKYSLERQLNSQILKMWPQDYQEERKLKLTKMDEVISELK